MTIPSEEVRSLQLTRRFLEDILKTDGRVSRFRATGIMERRRRARACLRHFPPQDSTERIWKKAYGKKYY